MVSCSAFGCSNRSDRKDSKTETRKKITFHKFPKDINLRTRWVNAVQRQDWQPSETSVLCSEHFTEECFDRTLMNITKLKKDAVPTLFPAFPSYLKQAPLPKRRELKRKLSPISEVSYQAMSKLPNVSVTSCYELDNPQPSTSQVKEDVKDVPLESLSWKQLTTRTTSFSPDRKHRSNISPRVEKIRKVMQLNIERYRKKVKALQQTKRRQSTKVSTMKDVLESLKKTNLLLNENVNILRNISGPSKEIFKRQFAKTKKRVPKVYNPELRKFALTLHYYSPKAYSYVRETFNTCLPHPKTLSKWYATINGKPGFTSESFLAINQIAEKTNHQLLCALSVDEVAIRKHLDYDGHETVGYVDMGTDLDGDDRSLAKDALVFMVVCINDRWKVPVGYFLTDGVNAEQRANLVRQCVTLSDETGVRILTLTFDGTASNVAMATELGCCFDNIFDLVTFFEHPVTGENIYVYLDPCHMIKLIRNTFGDKGVLYDENNCPVLWEYIKKLHDLQESEGLHLANKLTALHINFAKQKMKVRLATQVFSNSVADALKFCKDAMKLPDFQGCEATIKFIQLFNNLFDVYNSKSLNQLNFSKPIHQENRTEIFSFLDAAANYILNLKININGTLVLQTNRKTGFLGFLICIRSLKAMYVETCDEKKLLLYTPMHKISQDHLELFFGIIRSHCGSNNNPTCKQFMSAYKKNLVHLQLKASDTGNCIPLEEISILTCNKSLSSVEQINLTTPGYRYDDSVIPIEDDSDHMYLKSVQEITFMSSQIINYIAGFVVRHLFKSIQCEECLNELIDENNRKLCQLTDIKDRGALIIPSTDVMDICKSSEKCVKQVLAESGGKYILKKFTPEKLVGSVLHHYYNKVIFKRLTKHSLNQSPLDNHIILLIKSIAHKYIDIRLHYIAKRAVDTSESKRKLLSKIILFKGQ